MLNSGRLWGAVARSLDEHAATVRRTVNRQYSLASRRMLVTESFGSWRAVNISQPPLAERCHRSAPVVDRGQHKPLHWLLSAHAARQKLDRLQCRTTSRPHGGRRRARHRVAHARRRETSACADGGVASRLRTACHAMVGAEAPGPPRGPFFMGTWWSAYGRLRGGWDRR